MHHFPEDPFLCNDCQQVGYCKRRATQAKESQPYSMYAAVGFGMKQHSSFDAPILSDDPEPMSTFREFVAVHRPDLSKHLPKPSETEGGITSGKPPSLGELRAKIAARKISASQEAPIQVIEPRSQKEQAPIALAMPENAATPESIPVTLPKLSKKPPLYAAPRVRTDLRRFGEKPATHQHYVSKQVSSTAHKEKKTLLPG